MGAMSAHWGRILLVHRRGGVSKWLPPSLTLILAYYLIVLFAVVSSVIESQFFVSELYNGICVRVYGWNRKNYKY